MWHRLLETDGVHLVEAVPAVKVVLVLGWHIGVVTEPGFPTDGFQWGSLCGVSRPCCSVVLLALRNVIPVLWFRGARADSLIGMSGLGSGGLGRTL